MKIIDELIYPLDRNFILKNKKKIKRAFSKEKNLIKIKLAILSGVTVGDIKDIIDLFLLSNGIEAEIYVGQYNRFYEDALFENKDLEMFHPDVILIHTTSKNINFANSIENEYEKYHALWKHLKEKFACKIIQNNFDLLDYRILGNKDCYDLSGRVYFLQKINMLFSEYAMSEKSFFINDINYLSAQIGLEQWHNSSHWYLYKYGFAIEYIPDYAYNFSKIMKSLCGKNKKCLVLDLDNTLWGGIIGDVGQDYLAINSESPLGDAYEDFQKYVKALKNIGIVLTLVSKNEESIAVKALSSLNMPLHENDFVAFRINWNRKSDNIKEILAELNLFSDALVFVDDNSFEKYEVTQSLPSITTIKSEYIIDFIRHIDRNGFFEATSLVLDDQFRTSYYQADKKRQNESQKFENYDAYLRSLNMRSIVETFSAKNVERICQLINKTNQFNLTQKKYSIEEILEMRDDANYITMSATLDDKFGSNGLVSALVAHVDDGSATIDNWVMSCRVFKRNLELGIFDSLVAACSKRQLRKIVGKYRKTEKNAFVAQLYDSLGFLKQASKPDYNVYEYFIEPGYLKKNKNYILVEGVFNG